jgi:hypothetical protein
MQLIHAIIFEENYNGIQKRESIGDVAALIERPAGKQC